MTDHQLNLALANTARVIADHNSLSHDHEDYLDAAHALHRQGVIDVDGKATRLAKVDEVLREHGFEYPLGARGVDDAIGLQTARWEAAEARIEAALALHRQTVGGYCPACVEDVTDGGVVFARYPCATRRALTEDATA